MTEEGATEEQMDGTHIVNTSPVVNDFVPRIKAICDTLEAAKDNILIISDLKKELRYRLSSGHRRWRHTFKKLKDLSLVEEFDAQVAKRQVKCLRLLKPFSPSLFDILPSGLAGEEDFPEQMVKVPSRGLVSEQVVELPIERQVFDMVEMAGSSGVTVSDLCRRLSINNKKYYKRLLTMFNRFGMILKSEEINKNKGYRVWTAPNYKPGFDNPPYQTHPAVCEIPALPDIPEDIGDSVGEMGNGLALVPSTESITPLEVGIPLKFRTFQGYPCKLYSTSVTAIREQKILQLLEEEKFILRSELHRLLEGNDPVKKKPTLDRKTVTRLLSKLQSSGLCRCVEVPAPVITNCSGYRRVQVILHPSFHESISPALLDRIHDKFRSFDSSVRRPPSTVTDHPSLPVLDHVQRVGEDCTRPSTTAAPTRANGFVRARMVRVRLLHKFLWTHISGSGHAPVDLTNPHTVPSVFSLDEAVRALPLEVFLQVVGTVREVPDMVQRCNSGVRLCDLPKPEYRLLMDTQAACRLSWTVDILRRLKLIRVTATADPEFPLRHALELKPYIEEPVTSDPDSSSSVDLRPRARHDFLLSSPDAVDTYWRTLEFCYAVSDPASAVHAFPGSVVPDLCVRRSWTTVRVLTAEQRAGVREWLHGVNSGEKLGYRDAAEASRRLSVSLHLLLRAFYEKRRAAGPVPEAEPGMVPEQREVAGRKKLLENSTQPNPKRRRNNRTAWRLFRMWEGRRVGGDGGRKSVAVSNAVELLKVVFLNASSAMGVAEMVAGTLRRYSEHDLFAAFDHLKEKNIIVPGNDLSLQPFVISRSFLREISAAVFPPDSGKRSEALLELLTGVAEGGRLELDGSNLQCGEIFLIFGMVYSGVFLVGPPDLTSQGTGETEKSDSFSRKKKGFPGISLSLIRVESIIEEYSSGCSGARPRSVGGEVLSEPDIDPDEPAGSILAAIQLAGDQGLSLKEISARISGGQLTPTTGIPGFNGVQLATEATVVSGVQMAPTGVGGRQTAAKAIGPSGQLGTETTWVCGGQLAVNEVGGGQLEEMEAEATGLSGQLATETTGVGGGQLAVTEVGGGQLAETVAETLCLLRKVVKVNSFDTVHYVDALYGRKYSLGPNQGWEKSTPSVEKSTLSEWADAEVHKVTILNRPEVEGPTQSDGEFCWGMPILPWLNGDGSLNATVYKGLSRRMIGMLIQNPGMLEEDIVARHLAALNPQSCLKLLELLVLDKHLSVRMIHQRTPDRVPACVGRLLGPGLAVPPQSVYRKHFFANPLSISML